MNFSVSYDSLRLSIVPAPIYRYQEKTIDVLTAQPLQTSCEREYFACVAFCWIKNEWKKRLKSA